jgi:hypothetical protein
MRNGIPTLKPFEGKRLANSGAGGDAATGQLTSPDFKIERRNIRFLIGGAELSKQTSIDLVVDGKTARIEIIDHATNAAGHILVHGVTGLTFGGNIYSNQEPLKLESEKRIHFQSLRTSELKSAWHP